MLCSVGGTLVECEVQCEVPCEAQCNVVCGVHWYSVVYSVRF